MNSNEVEIFYIHVRYRTIIRGYWYLAKYRKRFLQYSIEGKYYIVFLGLRKYIFVSLFVCTVYGLYCWTYLGFYNIENNIQE